MLSILGSYSAVLVLVLLVLIYVCTIAALPGWPFRGAVNLVKGRTKTENLGKILRWRGLAGAAGPAASVEERANNATIRR